MNQLQKRLERLLEKVWVAMIECTQFGDSGKGMASDLLALWADIIIRGTGFDNAGHTVQVEMKKLIFHLIPSSILHADKIHIIGSGVAINPATLLGELTMLDQEGVPYDHLLVSREAKLILPQHIALDQIREKATGRIGTTGRGGGPLFSDFFGERTCLFVRDLLNPDSFIRNLRQNLREKILLLRGYDPEVVASILHDPKNQLLRGGLYYGGPEKIFNEEAIIEQYLEYGRQLAPLIADTDSLARQALGRKKILLEGAQGMGLSPIAGYGTYPFVTSSDPSPAGLAQGAGLTLTDVDLIFAVAKFPYMTRVGNGPLSTIMGGKDADEWCAATTTEEEAAAYPNPSFTEAKNDMEIGIMARSKKKGSEFGATTGRRRKIAWEDSMLVKNSIMVMGRQAICLVLTKLDVFTGCPVIKLCVAYKYTGPDYRLDGKRTLHKGDILTDAIMISEVLQYCEPIYKEFPGWTEDISHATTREELPANLLRIIEFAEEYVGVKAAIISVGPDRDQTIIC
ncbi:MAG: adenylosuccinate synthetase [Patescibacteria group bacterium]|jgi:adenylosuccinate synthase